MVNTSFTDFLSNGVPGWSFITLRSVTLNPLSKGPLLEYVKDQRMFIRLHAHTHTWLPAGLVNIYSHYGNEGSMWVHVQFSSKVHTLRMALINLNQTILSTGSTNTYFMPLSLSEPLCTTNINNTPKTQSNCLTAVQFSPNTRHVCQRTLRHADLK